MNKIRNLYLWEIVFVSVWILLLSVICALVAIKVSKLIAFIILIPGSVLMGRAIAKRMGYR